MVLHDLVVPSNDGALTRGHRDLDRPARRTGINDATVAHVSGEHVAPSHDAAVAPLAGLALQLTRPLVLVLILKVPAPASIILVEHVQNLLDAQPHPLRHRSGTLLTLRKKNEPVVFVRDLDA